MCENVDKVAKVDDFFGVVGSVVAILFLRIVVLEEGVDNPIAQRIDGQLGNPQEILASQVALLLLVQAGEPTVQTLNLIRSD